MTDEAAPSRAQAAHDGELDAAQLIAFEAEMARSPELRAQYEALQDLSRTLHEHAPREKAPERLRARIEAMATPAPMAPAPIRTPTNWRPALAAAFALAAALIGYQAGRSGPDGDPALDELVAGYQRAALSGQPFDVASSDRHTVKPWLAARAPLGALVLDLADEGYPLAGGRIDIVDGRPVPTLVYRRREHLVSVSELPLAAATGAASAQLGYHIERWRDAERAYVAISDLDAADLSDFVARFQAKAPR